MISVSCTCGRKFKADDHHAGKRTRCPVCGHLLIIGQVVTAGPSAVNDNGEVPSWWFPTSSSSNTGSSTVPPTRSGSNPDDIQTVILPPKPSSNVDVAGPAGSGSHHEQLNRLRALIGILSGGLLLVILSFVLFSWLRSSKNVEQPGAAPPVNQVLPVDQKAKFADGESPHSASPPTEDATSHPEQLAGDTAASKHDAPRASPVESASQLAGRAISQPSLQLLVPAYFYPGGDGLKSWQRLIEAAAKVRVVTVANPGNGPGEQRNPDYFLVSKAASDKGVRVIGYISTGYGKRPLSEVKNEVDRWIEFYPDISGFFIDQQAASVQHLSYYLKVRDHARQRIKGALIISNPGSMCDEEYFVQSVADVICVFANFQGFTQFDLPPLLKQFSPTRFAALVYNVPTTAAMRTMVKDAISKRVGYLYVGDSPQAANPYSKLPAYWEDLVETVAHEK
jgi:hypothetical protein